jgi:heme-degrading monooxygenase HmoA
LLGIDGTSRIAWSCRARPGAHDRRAGVRTLNAMITRLWRGWTARADGDAYEQFLLTSLFPSMRSIPGFRGADVLRRDDGGEIEFVTVTRFDTLEAIRQFAGEQYETPVLEPEARALLSRYDERARHFVTSSFTT